LSHRSEIIESWATVRGNDGILRNYWEIAIVTFVASDPTVCFLEEGFSLHSAIEPLTLPQIRFAFGTSPADGFGDGFAGGTLIPCPDGPVIERVVRFLTGWQRRSFPSF
jgi:hypothetical protein